MKLVQIFAIQLLTTVSVLAMEATSKKHVTSAANADNGQTHHSSMQPLATSTVITEVKLSEETRRLLRLLASPENPLGHKVKVENRSVSPNELLENLKKIKTILDSVEKMPVGSLGLMSSRLGNALLNKQNLGSEHLKIITNLKEKINEYFSEETKDSPSDERLTELKNEISQIKSEMKKEINMDKAIKELESRIPKKELWPGQFAKKPLDMDTLDQTAILSLLQDANIINHRARPSNLNSDIKIVKAKGKVGSFTSDLYTIHIPANFSQNGKEENFILKKLQWVYSLHEKANPNESDENRKIVHRLEQTPITELQSLQFLNRSKLNSLDFSGNPNLPLLSFAAKVFFYFDRKIDPKTNEARLEKVYFTLLPKAPGVALGSLFSETPTEDQLDVLKTAMKKVGRSLGELQYQTASDSAKKVLTSKEFLEPNFNNEAIYIKSSDGIKLSKKPKNFWESSASNRFETVAHHDFHLGNIFYDTKTGRVSYIDTATMAETVRHPVPFWHDILYLYFMTTSVQKITTDDVFVPLMEEFLQGYVEAFPDYIQKPFYDNLLSMLDSWIRAKDDYQSPDSTARFLTKDEYYQYLLPDSQYSKKYYLNHYLDSVKVIDEDADDDSDESEDEDADDDSDESEDEDADDDSDESDVEDADDDNDESDEDSNAGASEESGENSDSSNSTN